MTVKRTLGGDEPANTLQSNYDVIIFDLDGTLIDSRVDLANSVNFIRAQLGLDSLDHHVIFSYIGDGAAKLIQRAVGKAFSPESVQQGVEAFLRYYRDHLLDNTVLYPGVLEVLADLGHQVLTVLTNKPLESTLAILQGLKIRDRFRFVYGGNSFEQKKPHPVGIKKILKDTRTPKNRALIVGDSRIDIATGQNAQIASCGVTYGLASNSLSKCNPQFLIRDLRELPPIILG